MDNPTLTDDQGGLYLVEDEDDAPERAREYPVATLWLPDPDTTHGWAMHHVWAPKAPRVSRAKARMGFR